VADRWLSFVEATQIVRRVRNLLGVGSAEVALVRWIESGELGWRAPGSLISPAEMHGWYGPKKATLGIKKVGDFFEITIRERSAHSPEGMTTAQIHKHDIEVSDHDLEDLLGPHAGRTASPEADDALAAPSQPGAEIVITQATVFPGESIGVRESRNGPQRRFSALPPLPESEVDRTRRGTARLWRS